MRSQGFLAALAAFLFPLSYAGNGDAEPLTATWHVTAAFADASGSLVRVPETTSDMLLGCGEEQLPPIDRSELVLVYDTSAAALEVVRARDGSVVCVPFRFAGGVAIDGGNGARVRQALVIDGASGEVIGSAVASVTARSGGGAAEWKVRISGGQHDAESGVAEIFEGVFRTGAKFAPRCAATR
jgi:hypothetical protein